MWSLVTLQGFINELTETGNILVLSLLAGVVVLALGVTLLVTALSIIRDIFIEIFEGSPGVKTVKEVVECLDFLLAGLLVAELGYGLNAGETSFGLEDSAPELVEVSVLYLLLGRWLDICVLIDGIVLATLDRVGEDFSGFLNALEEAVILGVSSCSLLVRMMAENLLSVGALDLIFGGSPAVFGYTKNGVMILLLGTNQHNPPYTLMVTLPSSP